MRTNAILDALNTGLDALVDALIVALNTVAKAMLANTSAAEWVLAVVLAFAAWILAGRRGSFTRGLMLFTLAASASAWLSWRTNHHGMVAQQAVLALMVLHGLLKARGWALVKGGARHDL